MTNQTTTQPSQPVQSAVQPAMDTAVALHRDGDLEGAEKLYRRILDLQPSHHGALHLIGVLHHQREQHDEAIRLIGRAINLHSNSAIYFNNFGASLLQAGRLIEAYTAFRHSLELAPHYADALTNLARALRQLRRPAEAITTLEQALEVDASHVDALALLSELFAESGRTKEADRLIGAALQLRPTGRHYLQQGNLLLAQRRSDEAIRAYKQAAAREPQRAAIYYNLASAYYDQHRDTEAVAAYRRAAELNPRWRSWQYRADISVPAFFDSTEEITAFRQGLTTKLDEIAAVKPKFELDELASSGFFPPFALAYHGENNRTIKAKFAGLFDGLFAGNLVAPASQRSGKPRVGIVVTAQHEGIFLWTMKDILRRLSKDDFELVILCSQAIVDRLCSELAIEDLPLIPFPHDLTRAAQIIGDARCDVLHYWEVCSDSMNYFLPHFRLAPVQTTSWGSQVTTGIPTIDYFLSSRLMEGDGAQDHYSERLWLADTLLTYQERLPLANNVCRDELGLPESAHLYVSFQNPMKYHPDFDQTLAAILRRDPEGIVVLSRGRVASIEQRLRARMERTAADVLDRVRFLPRLESRLYTRLLQTADVALEPTYFGSGSTAYDLFSFNLPTVVCPGRLSVSRVVSGCYQTIGMPDEVAENWETYVDQAVELGTNRDYRESFRQRMAKGAGNLFQQQAVVSEHQRFFAEMVEIARSS